MSSAVAMNESTAFFADKRKVYKFLGVVSLFALAVFALFMPEQAMAAGAADSSAAHTDDFDDIWETLVAWTQGSLGRVIAGAMILVGIIGGIARQSLMAFAIGIAGGMGLTYAPNIIDTVISASAESVASGTLAAQQIANGLGM